MSGLDPIGRKEVKDIMLHLKERGKTIFFSTHILPDVEVICDRVAILVKGELRSMGAVGELLEGVEAASVEMTFEGLSEGDLAAVKVLSKTSFVQGRKATAFFDDSAKAKEAKELIYKKGGDIISLIPHKRSLEDIFIEEVKKDRA
jgi:ABC-2 type transport system ATP-binding protein